MSAPLLVIGLDGASFEALDRLRADGTMPTLDRLARDGVTRELASVVPPITPVAWTSFLTGKTPAKHGVFDLRVSIRPAADACHRQRRPRRLRVVRARDGASRW